MLLRLPTLYRKDAGVRCQNMVCKPGVSRSDSPVSRRMWAKFDVRLVMHAKDELLVLLCDGWYGKPTRTGRGREDGMSLGDRGRLPCHIRDDVGVSLPSAPFNF